jgi:hypothetical protein
VNNLNIAEEKLKEAQAKSKGFNWFKVLITEKGFCLFHIDVTEM